MEEPATENDARANAGLAAFVLPRGVTQPPGSRFATWHRSPEGGLALGPALLPDTGYLAINGSIELSGYITGIGGAKVSTIHAVSNRQYKLFQYAVAVYGQGAADAVPGSSLDLLFMDQTGETHALALRAGGPQWHYVQYNARRPGIIRVQWSSIMP